MRWPQNMEKYVKDVEAFLKEAGGTIRGVAVSKRAHLMLGSETYKEVDFETSDYRGIVDLENEKKGAHVRNAPLLARAYFKSLDKVPFALDIDMSLVEHLMEPDDVHVKADLGTRHGYEMSMDVRGRNVYVFGKDLGDGNDKGYDSEVEKLGELMKKHGFVWAGR